MSVRIVAYTFEADIHCPACTAERANVGLLTRVSLEEQAVALRVVS